MALVADLWRECSSPISDLRVSNTVSMTRRLGRRAIGQGCQLDFPQFLSCAGLCGGPEDVLGGDEVEGAID